jgi:hypothetical protein
MRIFPKNPALSLLCLYGPLTSCKISEKTNEPIMRKVCYRRTSWLRWIYRIFPVNRGSKKRSYIWSKRRLKCYISIQINDQTKKNLTCQGSPQGFGLGGTILIENNRILFWRTKGYCSGE